MSMMQMQQLQQTQKNQRKSGAALSFPRGDMSAREYVEAVLNFNGVSYEHDHPVA